MFLGMTVGRLLRRRTPLPATTPRFGRPQLRHHDDGTLRCTACGLCSAACPSGCISVSAGPLAEDEPVSGRRQAASFRLDLASCVLCGLCAEACPVEALSLHGDLPSHVQHRQELSLNRDVLSAD